MIREDNILQYVITILIAAVVLVLSCIIPHPLDNHIVWLPIVFLGIVAVAEGACGLMTFLRK